MSESQYDCTAVFKIYRKYVLHVFFSKRFHFTLLKSNRKVSKGVNKPVADILWYLKSSKFFQQSLSFPEVADCLLEICSYAQNGLALLTLPICCDRYDKRLRAAHQQQQPGQLCRKRRTIINKNDPGYKLISSWPNYLLTLNNAFQLWNTISTKIISLTFVIAINDFPIF